MKLPPVLNVDRVRRLEINTTGDTVNTLLMMCGCFFVVVLISRFRDTPRYRIESSNQIDSTKPLFMIT